MESKNIFKGCLFVIVSAVIFGSMPLMATNIYADGINSVSLVFWRNFLSLPLLFLLAKREKASMKISLAAIPSVAFIALFGCCLTPILLLSSYNYIASGTSTVFHFIYPALVVILEFVFFRKKIGKAGIISLALCIFGICLFYTPGAQLDAFGSMIALLSGLTYALYVVLLSAFRFKEISGFVFSFYVSLISSVIMFLFCFVTEQFVVPATIKCLLLCILFAFTISGAAVVLFQRGTFYIGGARASILSALEPVTSVVIGAVIMHEAVGIGTVLGTVLVVAATVLISVAGNNKEA